MSNDNNGLGGNGLGPVVEKSDAEITMGWFKWIGLFLVGLILGTLHVTGMAAGATVRRSAGVPGATKRGLKKTKEAAVIAWEVTKEGYEEARYYTPPPADVEDAEEVK